MSEFLVLGLEGGAGSGKDLVADWLSRRRLTKIAFADPLKRFVNKTFNFSFDNLWGPSTLRNEAIPVDHSWWFNSLARIPTASDEFLNGGVLKPEFRLEGYLKLMEWFTTTRKKHPDLISSRILLQTLGTEWGRYVDPLMWVDYNNYCIDLLKGMKCYTQLHGLSDTGRMGDRRGAVIPDHRFANELVNTQGRGGYVIRLRRLIHESKEETVGISGHQSEMERKGIPDSDFDLVLEMDEFTVEERFIDGQLVEHLVGFEEAMTHAMEGRPWTKGRGTVVRVGPSS